MIKRILFVVVMLVLGFIATYTCLIEELITIPIYQYTTSQWFDYCSALPAFTVLQLNIIIAILLFRGQR